MNINETLQEAIRCHQAGQVQEAERLYRSILQIHPNQPESNHNLGLLAMQVGQAESGLPYLLNVWISHPQNEQFCLTLTNCLLTLDRPVDALMVIKDGIQRNGFNSAQANDLLQLAGAIATNERPPVSTEQQVFALFGAGKHEELQNLTTSLLNQYPHWAAGWNVLCTSLQIQGKDSAAALERTVQLLPDNDNPINNQNKVFCIGANKTGTTSVEHVFKCLGLTVGNQEQAEMLLFDWDKRDYRRLIKYCQLYDAFQDVPFSLQGTYKVLDSAFPKSKFILTLRNNANEWFDSLLRFHTAIVGKGRTPTADDLRQFNYRYPGFVLDVLRLSYGAEQSTLYNRDAYIKYYNDHNNQVKEYFKDRAEDLLVLNVEDADAMERLVTFLGYPYTGQQMPHLNASA